MVPHLEPDATWDLASPAAFVLLESAMLVLRFKMDCSVSPTLDRAFASKEIAFLSRQLLQPLLLLPWLPAAAYNPTVTDASRELVSKTEFVFKVPVLSGLPSRTAPNA